MQSPINIPLSSSEVDNENLDYAISYKDITDADVHHDRNVLQVDFTGGTMALWDENGDITSYQIH